MNTDGQCQDAMPGRKEMQRYEACPWAQCQQVQLSQQISDWGGGGGANMFMTA